MWVWQEQPSWRCLRLCLTVLWGMRTRVRVVVVVVVLARLLSTAASCRCIIGKASMSRPLVICLHGLRWRCCRRCGASSSMAALLATDCLGRWQVWRVVVAAAEWVVVGGWCWASGM